MRTIIPILVMVAAMILIGYTAITKVENLDLSGRYSGDFTTVSAANLLMLRGCNTESGIDIAPKIQTLTRGEDLLILNQDSQKHTLEIGGTTLKDTIAAGDQWEISTYKLSRTHDKWKLICDGVDLGEATPKLMLTAP